MSSGLLYLDSSALVKLVLAEAESTALMAFLSAWEHRVSSAVATVEVERAARRASATKEEQERAVRKFTPVDSESTLRPSTTLQWSVTFRISRLRKAHPLRRLFSMTTSMTSTIRTSTSIGVSAVMRN